LTADKLVRTLGVPFASVWHAGAGRPDERAPGAGSGEAVPDEVILSRAAQQALGLAQQEKSTWTRADLITYLAESCRTGLDPVGDQVGEVRGAHHGRLVDEEQQPRPG
jgi:hypothetical protein